MILLLSFPHLKEVSDTLDEIPWLLVGGMMVQVHCAVAEIEYARTTSDVDIVVAAGRLDLHSVKSRLVDAGFNASPSMNSNILHKFVHPSGWHLDVMVKDRQEPLMWDGLRTIQCPGSSSALGVSSNGDDKELLKIVDANRATIKIPDVWSAIALKGRAYRQPSANIERHMRDGLALFACTKIHNPRDLTRSERQAFNYLLSSSELGNLEHWTDFVREKDYANALRGIFKVRTDTDLQFPPELGALVSRIRSEFH